ERCRQQDLQRERHAIRGVEIDVALLHQLLRDTQLFQGFPDADAAQGQCEQAHVAGAEQPRHHDALNQRQALRDEGEGEVDEGAPPGEAAQRRCRRQSRTVLCLAFSRTTTAVSYASSARTLKRSASPSTEPARAASIASPA